MYSQTFLVTSVRAIFLPPQMAARLSDSALGAKMPAPFFFIASALFLPALLMLVLPIRFFSAVVFFNVVVATVVFVVVVIAIGGGRVHASVEP